MDLKQRKLNRDEWNSIEILVSPAELDILQLITKGYSNVNIRMNKSNSLFMFLKIEFSEKMENHLYNKYFREKSTFVEDELKKIDTDYKPMKVTSDAKINSADKVRLERFNETTVLTYDIYELLLLNCIIDCLSTKKNSKINEFHYYYYTLYKLIKNTIIQLNRHVKELTTRVLNILQPEINIQIIIQNGVQCIEKNEKLLKYGDMMLYEHQKEIFTICKITRPKLILYMAPTGTGKTLTPIALSEEKKIIFVCAARHVGLALARSAISIHKKIAFAFGCASADDIRLHYFAAKDYTRNKRTGGIGKVDNSVGDNVEMMICDIKSYLPAMYYMLAFFPPENIILYWDEPTITLDYEQHEFHETIQKNWCENRIPNVVLSSATLPKKDELTETITDFLTKFPDAEIYNIVSHDCKKSIPIINKDGFVVLPHYLATDYSKLVEISQHCNDYLTLLRYFDLKEVIEFICYVNEKSFGNSKSNLFRYFENLDDITMKNIKMYYVYLLQNILPDKWGEIFEYFNIIRTPRIFENNNVDPKGNKIIKSRSIGPGVETVSVTINKKGLDGAPITRIHSEQIVISKKHTTTSVKGTSGAYVTTKDAYTLTDGPTIFISDDVEKIAKFCIQQANIPSIVMDEIMKKIEYNNVINLRIFELEAFVDEIKEETDKKMKNEVSSFHNGMKIAGRSKSSKDSKKLSKDVPDEIENKGKLSKFTQEINTLRSMIKSATLNDAFVPNKKMHLDKWKSEVKSVNAFTSNIDEQVVSDIMALKCVENSWKILLMMGIGVFINHENIAYTEIMKKLADSQKLYMIIATSDYIYGTNYQFCHGFLSKDLNLTQEKVIQAMGRIGRTNIQQTYTIRFRDDEQIMKLFTSDTAKPEVKNMNKLFCSV